MSSPFAHEEALFTAALARPEGERAAFLDEACGADPALRARLAALLEADAAPNGTLGPGVGPSPASAEEQPGARIGRYRLLQKIGMGGCGVVYLADQLEGVRRRVALKIIKLGMDTREVIGRFELERQALALMDHPNIAQVFDAGATDSGRPYFVMELVRGLPITRFCDEQATPTAQRLELFIQVCRAVQHAHQKGIIHRDLKPSNILVTVNDGVPVPKIIDFGIAKATQGRLTDQTVFTAFEQFVGTPAYMSPEQAVMTSLDIDTRSDVYSLGVLLYELLTGRTPFDAKELAQAGFDEIRRRIRELDPPKPSARLSTMEGDVLTLTAQHRQIEAPKLISLVRGDLDWIVMRCLEKDRGRRYETANGLARDVQRHLNHEPVSASPPGMVYRSRKLVLRHQTFFAAAAVVAAALAMGLAVSVWQAVRAKRAEQAATVALAQERRAQLRSQRLLYAADMNLVQQALRNNNIGRARRLLDRHRPQEAGEMDVRGWEWRYLWQQCRSEAQAQLTKHEAGAFTVSFSPDGRRLAVGYRNGRLEVWDLPNRERVRILRVGLKSGARLGLVAFSPRGDALASTGDVRVVLWHDFARGVESVLLQVDGVVQNLAFSNDGTRLVVTTHSPGEVYVVDPEKRIITSRHATPNGTGQHFDCARLSADRERLYFSLIIEGRAKVRCLRLSDKRVLWEADAGTDRGISTMALSPDDRVLAIGTGYEDGSIKVWNAMNGEQISVVRGHTRWVAWLAFSPDGHTLMSASADQTVRLWDVATWREKTVLRGHADEVHAVAFSPLGEQVVSGCKDGAVLLWEVGRAKALASRQVFPDRVQMVWALPGGKVVLAQSVGGAWSTFALATMEEVPLSFAPGQRVSFHPPNVLGLVEGAAQLQLFEVLAHGRQPLGEVPIDAGFNGRFAYCPAGRWVAWSTGSGALQVAQLGVPQSRREIHRGRAKVSPVNFSPDGTVVRGMADNGYITAWDVGTGAVLLSGDYALLSMENYGLKVGFDNRPTLRPVLDAFHPAGGLTSWAMTADARAIAIASQSGVVTVYDRAEPWRHAILQGHMQGVNGLAFSPDGKRLATASGGDEAVKLWDVETQQELLTLAGRGSLISKVEFSDDGDTLLIATRDRPGFCQFWRVPSWAEISAENGGNHHGLRP